MFAKSPTAVGLEIAFPEGVPGLAEGGADESCWREGDFVEEVEKEGDEGVVGGFEGMRSRSASFILLAL